jgi:hypothetical protein
VLEAPVRIVERVDAVTPALVAEGRIGDDVVESLEGITVLEFRIGQRVALQDERRGLLCRIIFILARPAVAASFSCP